MRLRTIALAGAATAALSTPAFADHVGWYLGLGAGYEQTQSTRVEFTEPGFGIVGTGKARFNGSGIYLLDGGYKWDSGLRVEGELAYTDPGAKLCFTEGRFCRLEARGGADIGSLMINFVWDWALAPDRGVSLGGGVGAANVNMHIG